MTTEEMKTKRRIPDFDPYELTADGHQNSLTTNELKVRAVFVRDRLQKGYNEIASLNSRIHVRQQKIEKLKRRLALYESIFAERDFCQSDWLANG